jgi:cytochrome c-type biogenesis protein CcmE
MRYRAFVIPAIGLVVVIVGFLVFGLLNDNLVYFKTPTELMQGDFDGSRVRLGGQVVEGTVVEGARTVEFEVGDGQNVIDVVHDGAPAQLFQPGVGVVVEGRWDGATFHSDTMLIKHDEQYRSEDGSVYKPGEGFEQ